MRASFSFLSYRILQPLLLAGFTRLNPLFVAALITLGFGPSRTQSAVASSADLVNPEWVSLNPNTLGVNGAVSAFAVDENGKLFVGGEFTSAGIIPANNVACWDGRRWFACGPGPGGRVHALAVGGGVVYASGYFTNAAGTMSHDIAKWDGHAWSRLGSGLNESAVALAVNGTNLYAGGFFTSVNGLDAMHVARWDGHHWSPLGAGVDGPVHSLAMSGTNLYVSGSFTNAGGGRAVGIAMWNGQEWSAVGSELGGSLPYVSAMLAEGTNLYVGGSFTYAGGVPAVGVAKWNGHTWTNLGAGLGPSGDYTGVSIFALAGTGTNLYAGGFMGELDISTRIARWDGNAWQIIGHAMNGISDLAVVGANVYAGGSFEMIDGWPRSVRADHIAKWDGSVWTPLLSGINDRVSTLVVCGRDVYVGGRFTLLPGEIPANHIAKWDGNNWSPLGSGMDGPVYSLVTDGTNVYVGGAFMQAGGTAASHVAKWDGANWSGLGEGLNAPVSQLTWDGSSLYAATANGMVARWNGTNWTGVGSPLPSGVRALAASGSSIFAGGQDGVAEWNGTEWTLLPSLMWGGVNVLLADGTNLYAGGNFSGPEGNHVSKWNGTVWSPVGSGVDAYVFALLRDGDVLYAGSVEWGTGAKVSQWDGTNWSDLGAVSDPAGWDSVVEALALDHRGHLFVGGNFCEAQGVAGSAVVSPFVAQVNLPGLPILVTVPQSQTVEAGQAIELLPEVVSFPSGTCGWFFNGTNVGCATNGSLILSGVDDSCSGLYTLVVSNVFGAVTSAPVALSVVPVVERRLVPALSLLGPVGMSLKVDCTESLGPDSQWTTLNLVNPIEAPQFHFDVTSPLPPQRFYRAELLGRAIAPPSLKLPFMVPAIILKGNPGETLRLDYINAIGPTDAWVSLSIQTLTNASQFYFDVSSVGQPRRVYRIVPEP